MKLPTSSNNLCCNDVMQCIFNLNLQDLEIFNKLKKTGEQRADELAKNIGKDRSTIYRSLQKLTCCNMVIKKTNKISTGGYFHTYICNDIKKTKKELEKCIDKWHKQMKDTIKNLN